MKIHHYRMIDKLDDFFGFFPEESELDLEVFGREWQGSEPALVVYHPGTTDADEALRGWYEALKAGQLSVLLVTTDGFKSSDEVERMRAAYGRNVHALGWGILNEDELPEGESHQEWKIARMRSFLDDVVRREENPPEWKILEAPARPEVLLAGYILRRLGKDIPEAWTIEARAEFDRLMDDAGTAERFAWNEAQVAEALQRAGHLDERG